MNDMQNSNEFFEHVSEFSLIVCKKCHHAVWPHQIKTHLQGKQHRIAHKQAVAIAQSVQSWSGVIQDPSAIWVPKQVEQAIPVLMLQRDGQLCRLDPTRCRYICRAGDSMRRHWRQVHQWSVVRKRGGSGSSKHHKVQKSRQRAMKSVWCQRFFPSRHGSQYFEVRQPGVAPEQAEDEDEGRGHGGWSQLRRKLIAQRTAMEDRARTTIQEGEADEVNPWLERAQWHPYLVNLNRPNLMACVEEPERDEEPVEAAIWEAMEELIRHSQQTVVNRVGVFICMEAMRTEKHQTRYRPLQPYMDEKALGNYGRPWQQVLMFFARTQKEHEWESPRYRFSCRQRHTWEELMARAEEDCIRQDEGPEQGREGEEDASPHDGVEAKELGTVAKACLSFCIALLDQQISWREYDSALVCALAVLGVKEGGWMGADQYPPILSAMIKIARFMVVQQAVELEGPPIGDEWASDDEVESVPKQKGCLSLVTEMMDRFMIRGSHGPMQWMLDLRTYGLKIHYNTTSSGNIDWVGDQILYKSIQFGMGEFRSMVHGLVMETRRVLMEELLFDGPEKHIPIIPWHTLRDNPVDGRPGWNFLQDARSQLPVEGPMWLFDRIGQDPAIQAQFIKRGAGTIPNQQGVESYMARVVEFREKLLVLMHITGGQPARAPEILSIRHSNTVKGEHRNVFVEDGMVVFATRYHKGYTLSGDVKIIHRYLPREVGELVVWYMWLVLSFQQDMEALTWSREMMSAHMWPPNPDGKKWTSERMRRALKRESAVGLGQALTIQAYREIAIGISRRYMRGPTAFRLDENDEDGDWDEDKDGGVADEQAGHTSHIAGMIYARGIMESSGVVASKRQRFRACSTMWHRFLGFACSGEAASKEEKGRHAAMPFKVEAEAAKVYRWKRLRSADVTEQLRRLHGEGAEFRGVQEAGIKAIMRGESPVVMVMATGGGKSLAFMLPAACDPGGTTVVVVPLIALRQDMKRRCQQLGIRCAEWNGRKPPDAAAVVLVTPESAVGDGFQTFLNRLKGTRQLDRIVIDECHMVLNRQYTFRKQLQQLGKLATSGTQMVMLTATLPPVEEEELWRRMYFPTEQVKMFRAPTARANIAYCVIDISQTGRAAVKEELMLSLIKQKLASQAGGKMVIYGNSVGKVQKLAERLSCDGYHHHASGKERMLKDFVEGRQRVIVATSALGLGVDIADIRVVIHAEAPRTLLDYAQESGRAGRDGLASEAIIIVCERVHQKMGPKEGGVREEEELMRQFVHGTNGVRSCRRVVLDGYLDAGVGRVGCKEGERACDICGDDSTEADVAAVGGEEQGEGEEMNVEQRHEVEDTDAAIPMEFRRQAQEREGPRDRFIRGQQEEHLEMERLRRQLAQWAGRCGICEGYQADGWQHELMECSQPQSAAAQTVGAEMQRCIRFERFSGCFWCGVPQEICGRWEDNGKGGYGKVDGGSCQYSGVVLSGVLGMVFGYKDQVWSRWFERLQGLGVDMHSDVSLHGYLGQKRRSDGLESNNLVGEFCWLSGLLDEG